MDNATPTLIPTPTTSTLTRAAIYRCRACKRAGRPDAHRVDFAVVRFERGPGGAFTGPDGVRRLTHYAGTVPGYPCPGCGAELHAKPLKGRVTEEPCGAKCLAAKGPTCDCSCGGKNHGAGHVARELEDDHA